MTNPVYDPNTPTKEQPWSTWQTDFIENFTVLGNAFALNHVPLDAASANGNHEYIQLLEQTESQITEQGEITVYTKDVPGQTDQVFMRYQGNGQEFQFTNYQIYKIPDFTTPAIPGSLLTRYFTFLPGGLICYFGFSTTFNRPRSGIHVLFKPPVAKNIISANFTPAQPLTTDQGAPSWVPGVNSVVVYTSYNFYYCVLANF